MNKREQLMKILNSILLDSRIQQLVLYSLSFETIGHWPSGYYRPMVSRFWDWAIDFLDVQTYGIKRQTTTT